MLLIYGLVAHFFMVPGAYALLIDFNEISNNSMVGSFYQGVNFSSNFIGWALIKSFGCGASPIPFRDMGIRIKYDNTSPAVLNYGAGFTDYFAFFVTLRSYVPSNNSCRIIILLWVSEIYIFVNNCDV